MAAPRRRRRAWRQRDRRGDSTGYDPRYNYRQWLRAREHGRGATKGGRRRDIVMPVPPGHTAGFRTGESWRDPGGRTGAGSPRAGGRRAIFFATTTHHLNARAAGEEGVIRSSDELTNCRIGLVGQTNAGNPAHPIIRPLDPRRRLSITTISRTRRRPAVDTGPCVADIRHKRRAHEGRGLGLQFWPIERTDPAFLIRSTHGLQPIHHSGARSPILAELATKQHCDVFRNDQWRGYAPPIEAPGAFGLFQSPPAREG